MDSALNNRQWLICHKTKQTKPTVKVTYFPNRRLHCTKRRAGILIHTEE